MKQQIIAQGTEKHLQIKNNKIDKCFSVGAEAIIKLDKDRIIKNRIKKSYRIKEIDERLRKSRTKSEAKIIKKLENIIPVPKIIKSDDKEIIEMQFIKGKKLSEHLEKLDYKKICKLIADNISKIHDLGIIHGDLTTSNMIFVEDDVINNKHNESEESPNNNLVINKKNKPNKRMKLAYGANINQSSKSEIANSKELVYFIDFGLAFHSLKIEDKAVDLHLLQQALEAKHFTISLDCWKIILNNYKAKDANEVLKRIKVIESRGRYKDKY